MRTWIVGTLAAVSLALAVAPARAEETAPTRPQATERIVPAPVAEVWKVFATAEGWKALGVAQAEVDFRVGGKIRTHYDAKGTLGDDKTIENTILAFEPHRMVAFRATKAPAGFPVSPEMLDRLWSVVTFEDLGGMRTRVTLRGHGYGADPESETLRKFFLMGNARTLDGLVERFAARTPDAADGLAPIEATIAVDAPPEDVFRAWTTADGIKGFLGVNARVELRLGGPFELEFAASAPAGQRGSEGCEVLSWLPGRMLSFTWNAPPTLPHARQQRTVVVVEMETESAGRSRVRLTHHGFREKAAAEPDHAEEWRKVRAYFAAAWPRVLQALEASRKRD
jgi:uncharacterized protein YndB with AHSA1/START domain